MLAAAVIAIVRFCTRFPWLIIALASCSAVASAAYAATHFAINTDINKLISPALDWRQRELAFEKDFPGHFGSTLIVVDAPSPEFAARASTELAARLAAQPQLFRSVDAMTGDVFFRRNALLFRPTAQLERLARLGAGGAESLGLPLALEERVAGALVDEQRAREAAAAHQLDRVVGGPGGAIGPEIAREGLLAPRDLRRRDDGREG